MRHNEQVPSDEPLLIRRLAKGDEASQFNCGDRELNDYLRRYALTNRAAGTAQTFVAVPTDSTVPQVVVGYYTLSSSTIERSSAPERLTKGLGSLAKIPTTLLGRFAVDLGYQKQGVGGDLLLDALRTAAAAAESVGSRAVELHAISDDARAFYEHNGFKVLDPEHNPYDLYMLMKDVKRSLRDQGLL